MNVAFRVDASLQIGSGHVMRCLTLADVLRERGARCHFICREHPGHLLELIRQRGYPASTLATGPENFQPAADDVRPLPAHAAWLGCDWRSDAEHCRSILEKIKPDWLVVDHYALDACWQAELKSHYGKLMVIDDLADRQHLCDVLLDQNLGRKVKDYTDLIPQDCELLVGPRYALLRPEFAALREYSLRRRAQPELRQILISMGGVDQHNATGEVLAVLKTCSLPANVRLTVVMGPHAPWLADVQVKAGQMPWVTHVLVNTDNMAQLMADADIAIGAAGSTSWERCCLGLPGILVCLASNQKEALSALEQTGAVMAMARATMPADLPRYLSDPSLIGELHAMSLSARKIVDGCGTCKVSDFLRE